MRRCVAMRAASTIAAAGYSTSHSSSAEVHSQHSAFKWPVTGCGSSDSGSCAHRQAAMLLALQWCQHQRISPPNSAARVSQVTRHQQQQQQQQQWWWRTQQYLKAQGHLQKQIGQQYAGKRQGKQQRRRRTLARRQQTAAALPAHAAVWLQLDGSVCSSSCQAVVSLRLLRLLPASACCS
ncbi:hypothetical protein COO60DRAFT_419603 [Scenedesmus sp. NREL 46B-D3]|nr:hypothetical protein COO60DRAFT_419603 [Scenedesmus sp. NREL 46B-D3]